MQPPQLSPEQRRQIANRRLQHVGTVQVPSIPSYSAQATFGATPSQVKRGTPYNEPFTEWLLRKEESSLPAAVLQIYDIIDDELSSADLLGWILPALGHSSELPLGFAWHLLAMQADGCAGKLLTDGHANAFHVRGTTGNLVALRIRWSRVTDWVVEADTRIDAVNHQRVRWAVGTRVFCQ